MERYKLTNSARRPDQYQPPYPIRYPIGSYDTAEDFLRFCGCLSFFFGPMFVCGVWQLLAQGL